MKLRHREDAVNDGVVVNVRRFEALPRFACQGTAHLFGFARTDGTADGVRYLAFVRRHRLPTTPQGKLRLVDADVLCEAIRAHARVPVGSKGSATAPPDAELLLRAGLRRTP